MLGPKDPVSPRVQGVGRDFVVVKAEGEKSMYQERGPCGQRGTGTEEGTNMEKRRNSKSRKGQVILGLRASLADKSQIMNLRIVVQGSLRCGCELRGSCEPPLMQQHRFVLTSEKPYSRVKDFLYITTPSPKEL